VSISPILTFEYEVEQFIDDLEQAEYMSTEVHQDRQKYTIGWDGELNAVTHRWNEFTSGEKFREGCEELLDVIEKRGASKMLVDTSGIRAHDDEDERWLQEEWMPRVIDAGVEHAATVHPDSVIAKMDMEEFMEGVEDMPYDAMLTADESEAREWLSKR